MKYLCFLSISSKYNKKYMQGIGLLSLFLIPVKFATILKSRLYLLFSFEKPKIFSESRIASDRNLA